MSPRPTLHAIASSGSSCTTQSDRVRIAEARRKAIMENCRPDAKLQRAPVGDEPKPSPPAPHQLPAAHLSLRLPQHLSAPSDARRYAAERGSAIPTPPTTLHTRTAYTPNRRHDSASSATYPPTRPRRSRLMLSAISPAPRRQSGSAHRTAPGRFADLRVPVTSVAAALLFLLPPLPHGLLSRSLIPFRQLYGERKGNHAHNGLEKRNGKQHQRQARRGDPSRQDNRRHLAEHPHVTKACSTASTSPAFSAAG